MLASSDYSAEFIGNQLGLQMQILADVSPSNEILANGYLS